MLKNVKNKKVLILISKNHYNLYHLGLIEYAKDNNIDIEFFFVDYPKILNGGFFNNLRYKFGLGFKKDFYNDLRMALVNKLDNIDEILFVSLFWDNGYFIDEKLKEKLMSKKCKLLFVDTIKSFDPNIDFFELFDNIFSLENQDVEYAKNVFNVNVEYLFIGSSYTLFKHEDENKIYDVSFIGMGVEKRLKYLELIAKYCYDNNKKLFILGHFWHNSNIFNNAISKLKFKIKYPILSKYVKNDFLQPSEVAPIYAKSKICLNININAHKSVNPRIFDVLCCNSLLITDTQDMTGVSLKPDRDFIMVDNEKGMLEAVKKYLEADLLRQKIALSGFSVVKENYLYKNTWDRIFKS